MDTNGFDNGSLGIPDCLRRLCEAASAGHADELGAALAEIQAELEEARGRARQLEAARDQAQAQCLRYRELFEFAPDAYLVTDRLGVIQEANQAAADLLGIRKPFLVDRPLPLFVAAEDRLDFYSLLSQLHHRTAVRGWQVRLRPRRPGGPEVVVAAINVSPIVGDPGAPAGGEAGGGPAAGRGVEGYRWMLRDITALLQAEAALREQKMLADSLIDTAQAAVLLLDDGGRILRANAFLYELSEYHLSDLEGESWLKLISEADRDSARMTFISILTGVPCRAVLHALEGWGGRRVVAWSGRALMSPPDQTQVLLVGHDLTELEQAQRQALQAERLAAIGQMVAGLAHESRNALQRTQACLERLRWKVPDRPEALDLVDRARRAQDDLVRLFEDVRAYAAPVRVSPEPVDLAEVWREAWGQVTAAHPDRDARLAEEAGGVDLLCRADRFQLRQVFRNLFENSLAACPGPVRVTVSVTLVGRPSSPALRVSVRDNGPGLDAEQRRRLFEPFYTTKVKGCGLGMAIARRLVEAHAGDISVGDGGPGAEFVLVLPRRGK